MDKLLVTGGQSMNKYLKLFQQVSIKKNNGKPLNKSQVDRCEDLPDGKDLIRFAGCDNFKQVIKKAGFGYYLEDVGYPKMKPGRFCNDCTSNPATCGQDLKRCKKKALKEKIYFTDRYIRKEVNIYG